MLKLSEEYQPLFTNIRCSMLGPIVFYSTSCHCSRRCLVLHIFYTRRVISSNLSMRMHPSQLVSNPPPNLKFKNRRKKVYPKTLRKFSTLLTEPFSEQVQNDKILFTKKT
jgi:hypothetical protein